MQNQVFNIEVNGQRYCVGYDQDNGVVEVLDCTGQKIANAQIDDDCEAIYYDYFNAECGNLEQGGSITEPDFYRMTASDLGKWLVMTHPEA